MESNSRSVARTRNLPSTGDILSTPLRNTLQAIFWSPLLLLTGIVHILCQPLTKRFLLGLIILDIPLEWGTHFAIRSDVASYGALEGFELSITTIALFGLFIGWLFTDRAENRQLRFAWNWPIATYTAAVIVSIFVASDPELSLFQISLMVEMLLLYIYLASNITTRKDIEFILSVFLIGGFVEGIYIIFLAATGHEIPLIRTLGMKTVIYLPERPGDYTRYGGTIGSPNYAAAYLAILIILALAIRQMNVPSYLRRMTIPIIALSAGALVVTFSRGGWIELILSIVIFVGARWLKSGISRRRILASVIAVTVVVLCFYIPNPISNRLESNDNGSAHARVPLMHLAWKIIAANPVLGVGANNFAQVMGAYEGSEFRDEWIYTVHNQYLLVWAETGAIGLAAYLWIYFNLFRRGWRIWKTGDPTLSPLGLAIVAGVAGLMSHMFVDIFDDRNAVQLLWLFMALIASCEMIRRREAAEHLAARTIEARQ